MRISDWSSDVCSSDLVDRGDAHPCEVGVRRVAMVGGELLDGVGDGDRSAIVADLVDLAADRDALGGDGFLRAPDSEESEAGALGPGCGDEEHRDERDDADHPPEDELKTLAGV